MSPRSPASANLRGPVLPLGIAALLFVGVGVWTLTGAVNVPFADEWRFVPWVLDFAAGELELADLWAPHNEHRLVLPQLVLLALVEPTGFDLRVGVLISWLCVGGVLLLVHRLGRATAPGAAWVVVLGAALLLTPAAWEVWTWGWAVQIPMVLLAAAVCAAVLARWRGGVGQTALLVAAGTAGALSFAAGLALLPLCAATVLAGRGDVPRARRWRHGGALGLAGVALLSIYLYGLPMGGGAGLRPASPAQLPMFAAAFVGAPFADGSLSTAIAFGAVAVVLLVGLAIALLRRPDDLRERALPWLFLAAFALGTACAASAGRTARGLDGALASRYLTFSGLVWMSLLALGLLVASGARARGTRRVALVALGLVLACGAPAWWSAWQRGVATVDTHNTSMWSSRGALVAGPPYPIGALEPLWPETIEVVAGAQRLREARLGPFAPGGGAAPHTRREPAPQAADAPRGEVVRIDSRGEEAGGPWHLEVSMRADGRVSYSRRSPSGNRHLRLVLEPAEVRRFHRELLEAGALELRDQRERGAVPWTWLRLLDPTRPGTAHCVGYSAPVDGHKEVQRLLVGFLGKHVPGNG
ncbi:MAG: hypothetical protein GC161_11865 [Planctomycetaceae bacterium]|nr:hypothetical protein [Planctomycetaceae bacterium]